MQGRRRHSKGKLSTHRRTPSGRSAGAAPGAVSPTVRVSPARRASKGCDCGERGEGRGCTVHGEQRGRGRGCTGSGGGGGAAEGARGAARASAQKFLIESAIVLPLKPARRPRRSHTTLFSRPYRSAPIIWFPDRNFLGWFPRVCALSIRTSANSVAKNDAGEWNLQCRTNLVAVGWVMYSEGARVLGAVLSTPGRHLCVWATHTKWNGGLGTRVLEYPAEMSAWSGCKPRARRATKKERETRRHWGCP